MREQVCEREESVRARERACGRACVWESVRAGERACGRACVRESVRAGERACALCNTPHLQDNHLTHLWGRASMEGIAAESCREDLLMLMRWAEEGMGVAGVV